MKFIFLSLMILQGASFKQSQLARSRVKTAYEEKEVMVQQYFKNKNLTYSGFQLFIRAFKQEQVMEVWIKQKNAQTYSLLHTYEFCTSSGTLGPKRKEGDLQIPEGIYHINHFNPESNFYLSLGINYPNASDNILSDKTNPGGAIYIHGSCVTIGCIPLTDDKIKELYVLAVEARNNGQEKIPVHIFPTRLTDEGLRLLKTATSARIHESLWENLRHIYVDFEQTKKLRTVKVDTRGKYQF
jgi:murein L,D-transpeptidase YafK